MDWSINRLVHSSEKQNKIEPVDRSLLRIIGTNENVEVGKVVIGYEESFIS